MPQCNINEIQQHHSVFAVSSLGMRCVWIEREFKDKVTFTVKGSSAYLT